MNHLNTSNEVQSNALINIMISECTTLQSIVFAVLRIQSVTIASKHMVSLQLSSRYSDSRNRKCRSDI